MVQRQVFLKGGDWHFSGNFMEKAHFKLSKNEPKNIP